MLPLMINLYTMRLGEAAAPLTPRIDDELLATTWAMSRRP